MSSASRDGVVVAAFDKPPEHYVRLVDAGLDQFNSSVAPLGEVRPLGAFATDSAGGLLGGAMGRTWGQCCELLQLWVRPDARSAGTGTRLLRQFEERGRSRGCRIFYLTTLSYQAPDFYRRAGYEVLASITGYPNGIVKYLMQRTEGEQEDLPSTQPNSARSGRPRRAPNRPKADC